MGAVENIKEIADLIKKIGDADLYRKIVELEHEVFELSCQNLLSLSKIEELKEILRVKQNIKYDGQVYYLEGDSVPYCPKCWEVTRALVHLTESASPSFGHCPNCENSFRVR
ncbi:MAG: hypothetical protein ACM31N_07680 [Deltaproteobacteria bacterium]